MPKIRRCAPCSTPFTMISSVSSATWTTRRTSTCSAWMRVTVRYCRWSVTSTAGRSRPTSSTIPFRTTSTRSPIPTTCTRRSPPRSTSMATWTCRTWSPWPTSRSPPCWKNCVGEYFTIPSRRTTRLPTVSFPATSWPKPNISKNICSRIPTTARHAFPSKPCGSRFPRPYLSRIWISISASVGYRRECTAATPHGCSTRTCPSAIPPAVTSTASRPTWSPHASWTSIRCVRKAASSTASPSCAMPSTTPHPTSPKPSWTRRATRWRYVIRRSPCSPTARLMKSGAASPTGSWSSRRSSSGKWRTCTTASSTVSSAPSTTDRTRAFPTSTSRAWGFPTCTPARRTASGCSSRTEGASPITRWVVARRSLCAVPPTRWNVWDWRTSPLSPAWRRIFTRSHRLSPPPTPTPKSSIPARRTSRRNAVSRFSTGWRTTTGTPSSSRTSSSPWYRSLPKSSVTSCNRSWTAWKRTSKSSTSRVRKWATHRSRAWRSARWTLRLGWKSCSTRSKPARTMWRTSSAWASTTSLSMNRTGSRTWCSQPGTTVWQVWATARAASVRSTCSSPCAPSSSAPARTWEPPSCREPPFPTRWPSCTCSSSTCAPGNWSVRGSTPLMHGRRYLPESPSITSSPSPTRWCRKSVSATSSRFRNSPRSIPRSPTSVPQPTSASTVRRRTRYCTTSPRRPTRGSSYRSSSSSPRPAMPPYWAARHWTRERRKRRCSSPPTTPGRCRSTCGSSIRSPTATTRTTRPPIAPIWLRSITINTPGIKALSSFSRTWEPTSPTSGIRIRRSSASWWRITASPKTRYVSFRKPRPRKSARRWSRRWTRERYVFSSALLKCWARESTPRSGVSPSITSTHRGGLLTCSSGTAGASARATRWPSSMRTTRWTW
jgi:Helicase conserved C-terminal domain./SNF2 family N-terminal domain.